MLLPDNIHPELSVYYNASVVLGELIADPSQSVFGLYQKVKRINNMSFMVFMLSLDWLYLIDAARLNENGRIELCS